jgi:acetyl-CoA carboxylase biotin carboxyl carrier protein
MSKPRNNPTRAAKVGRTPDAAPVGRAGDASPMTRTDGAAREVGGIDVAAIRELAEVVAATGLSELSIRHAGGEVTLRRGNAAPPPPPALVPRTAPAMLTQVAPQSAPPPGPDLSTPTLAPATITPMSPMPPPPEDEALVTVSSPFVGTFYRSPSPESPHFVAIGQRVKRGQVLCIVEAMKLMNEIESELDGTVMECLVENAQPVEYGQALFKIAP